MILVFFWLDCLNITKFPLHFCSKVASLLFLGQIVCSKVAQFHRDGYITLPDVLSDKELVLLEEIYMSLIRYSSNVFLNISDQGTRRELILKRTTGTTAAQLVPLKTRGR